MSNKKVVPISKSKKYREEKKKTKSFSMRRFGFLLIVIALLLALVGRIGYLQFVEGDELKQKQYSQTTAGTEIDAKRGTIFDCNGKALAISADVDTISINPKYIVKKVNGEVNDAQTQTLRESIAKKASELFSLDYNETLAKFNSDKQAVVIASKVELNKVDEFKEWLKENDVTSGINIDEDTKRYYPYSSLASNVIGACGTDNQGLDGLESEYDSILRGTNGKMTTSISAAQKAIPDQNEQYIAPENGSNLYLTIDSNIQSVAEKYLKQAVEENECHRGGNVIIEDPNTGKILAMATYPNYDLNSPFTPNETMISNGYDKLSQQEKTNELYKMWRNKAVVDTYEPGSTFKTIVAATALEENITQENVAGDFYCNGTQTVNGVTIKCAKYPAGHGSQTLKQALENSCNPALIQLGQRIGKTLFYKYLDGFGFFDHTGIDLPDEGNSSFWSIDKVGNTELATMSFGQRFTITPMQLVKAVSAIANEGVMVTPHLVDRIENTDTGNIETVETNVERQVISKETADTVKDIMQGVVEEGGGTYAQVSGYTIGGKTGTSEADPSHPENGYVSSFLAIAPVQNTKLVCLLTLYDPHSAVHYGGTIAAPVVSQILSEVLPYLNIPSNNQTTNEGTSNTITVPKLSGKTVAEARKTLESQGLKCSAVGDATAVVTEQVPKSGTQLLSGGIVKVYTQGNDSRVSTEVPDLKGVTLSVAKNMLEAKNLNISSTGSGQVIAQNPKAGTSVDEGTVITVTLQEKATATQN